MVWKIWSNNTFVCTPVPKTVPTEWIEGEFETLESAEDFIEANKDRYSKGIIMEIATQVPFMTEKQEITIVKFGDKTSWKVK